MSNLIVTNMCFQGKAPFKGILDYNKVLKKSKFFWMTLNEEIAPFLQLKIGKDGNTHPKIKTGCISIWKNGSVCIVGVKSRKEAEACYQFALSEIKGCQFLSKKAHGGR